MDALKKAKAGVYSKWSMRSISEHYKQHYFTEKNNQFHLAANIIDMVDFQYLNLNDNTYPSVINGTNSQDLIICRNVLIYFSKETTIQLMKKMGRSLVDNGILLLGASDPINIKGTDFIFHHQEGMVFSRQRAFNDSSLLPLKVASKMPLREPAVIQAMLSYSQLIALLDDARWADVLHLINTVDTSTIKTNLVLNAQAKACANLGKLEEALLYCENSLLLDSTNKDTYFINALALIELDRFMEAEAALRKALFLDRKFIEGHFQLAQLLIKNKKIEAGLKSLNNALVIIESSDVTGLVEGFNELTYGRFAEIIKSEIELATGSAYDKNSDG